MRKTATSGYTILTNNRRQHLPKSAPEEGSAGQKSRKTQTVRTGSWMGPPQGKRAPRVGPISIVIIARE